MYGPKRHVGLPCPSLHGVYWPGMIIAVGLEPKTGRAQPVSGALHRACWPEPSTRSPRTKIGGRHNGIIDGAYLGTPYILSLAMEHCYVRPTLFKLRYAVPRVASAWRPRPSCAELPRFSRFLRSNTLQSNTQPSRLQILFALSTEVTRYLQRV